MARVQQAAIDKARKVVDDLISSPAFPSSDELKASNRTLYNVVSMVRASAKDIPEKTICGLLVEALDIGNDVTGEALWKRYRREAANRDESWRNRDSGSDSDTSARLLIPPEISQTDLAAGITAFFVSHGYNCRSLLKTCLMAMNGMTDRMEVSEIKDCIDAQYRRQNGDIGDSDTAEIQPLYSR
jgi:hypothetical protein